MTQKPNNFRVQNVPEDDLAIVMKAARRRGHRFAAASAARYAIIELADQLRRDQKEPQENAES